MRLTRSNIAGFFRELRRRKVFRVAVGYGAAAWVTVEVSEVLLPVLGAPESAFPLVVALVALGFPIAMVLAWAFDITPEGVQRTPDLPPAPPRRPARPDACSIAALPFIDRSPAAEHQYLADGITEEIINGLARVKGYRVVGRTSAFAFRGREADARTIGDALGVACLVEGSMSVQGRRMRLHVQMVDTADGYASWSETFDRRIDDIFDLQEDIARSIVGALEGRARTAAGDEEGGAGARAPAVTAADGNLIDRSTASFPAYDLYLRGRVHWSERSPVSLRLAIDFFLAALEEDAAFAHAHAGLADCYAVLLDYGLLAPADAMDLARHHAAEALRLAPELAEAHGSTAIVAQIEWRWDDSERAFERALELNPGYAVAHHRYALLLAWQSRFDEARTAIARGLRTDPLSPAIAAAIGWIHYFARDFDAAIQAGREALERFPGLGLARISLGLAQLARDEIDAAIESFRAVLELLPGSDVTADGSSLRSLLAHALARAGCTDDAERLITILESGEPYASAYYRALPFIGLGRLEAALDRLEQAVDERCPQLIYIGTEPLVDPLRADPRFQRILAAVGLPARTHA